MPNTKNVLKCLLLLLTNAYGNITSKIKGIWMNFMNRNGEYLYLHLS